MRIIIRFIFPSFSSAESSPRDLQLLLKISLVCENGESVPRAALVESDLTYLVDQKNGDRIKQLLSEDEQNILICQWRADELFSEAEG